MKCAVCGASEGLHACSGCRQVAYCSKEHQKSHWRVHKTQCSPVRIAVDETLGRHYVSSRKLEMGEIVIVEHPVLKIPALESNPDLCLSCYRPTSSQADENISRGRSVNQPHSSDPPSCSKCHLPVCSSTCENAAEHDLECFILTKLGKAARRKEEFMTNLSTSCQGKFGMLIAILRVLSLMARSKNTEEMTRFQQLIDMEPNLGIERSDEFQRSLYCLHTFIDYWVDLKSVFERCTPKCLQLAKVSENAMASCSLLFKRIVAAFEINAFRLPDSEILAAFPRCAIMEHSCYPNVATTFDNRGVLHMRVLRPVDRGEHLSQCYTEPLWGVVYRRHHLRTTKFFECSCRRCEDPSELGTRFNAVKCPCCVIGYVEPRLGAASPKQAPEVTWKCTEGSCPSNQGKAQLDHSLLDDVSATLCDQLREAKKGSIGELESFLEEYGAAMHPNHHCSVEASRILSQLYGNLGGFACSEYAGGMKLSAKELEKKEGHCRKVLKVVEVLQPGASRLKGATLFELQSTLTQRAYTHFNMTLRSLQLQEARMAVQECLRFMSVDVPGSAEAQIAEAAIAELTKIELHLAHTRRLIK